MDSKKVIEKLVKIANNQQKIINKLVQTKQAQTMANAPASPNNPDLLGVLQIILGKLTNKNPKYSVLDATKLADNSVHVKMTVPAGDANVAQVVTNFKGAVAAHTGVTPEEVKITQQPA